MKILTAISLCILLFIHNSFSGDFKTELKNQLIGGFIGSAIGVGAGTGIAFLNQNDLGDLRKLITYPLYGQVFGNAIGHYVMTKERNPYPLALSMVTGLTVTAVITRNDSRELDGPYYHLVKPYGGSFTFVATLLLYQPIITTVCHTFWPDSKTDVTLQYFPNQSKGILLSHHF